MRPTKNFARRRIPASTPVPNSSVAEAVVAGTGAAALALGMVVLFGWLIGNVTLTCVLPGFTSMKVNTAICFTLAGLSLLCRPRMAASGRDGLGQAVGAAAGVIGLLTALEYAAHINLGIDQLLFPDKVTLPQNFPGRMSIITASCFMLFACGRVAAAYHNRTANACHKAAAFAGMFMAYMSILGYVYGARLFFHPLTPVAVALHTAIGLEIIFIGLTATRPDLGWLAQFVSPGAGGKMFRRMLPVAGLLLPAMGWLRLHGELAGFYDIRVGLALFASINVVLFGAIMWLISRQADRWVAEREQAWVSLSASERRLQETAEHLRATTEQMKAVIDASPVAIMAFDSKLNMVIWSQAAETMFGYAAAEVLGRPIPARMLSSQAAADKRAGTEEFLGAAETKLRRKDGRMIDTLSSVAAFYDPAGAVLGTVVAVTDVTERNAMQRQLQQAQKMEAIGQLTGGLAHDFNNLLGVVLGNLDILQEQQEAGSEAWELTDGAIHAAVRGAELTRQLLAFARQQPLAPRLVDLNDLLESSTRLLRRTLGEQIILELKVTESLWPVRMDASQLESAILNLAVNARDAMPKGGTLTMEAHNIMLGAGDAELNPEAEPGSYVAVAISDTGTGMPPGVMAKVFEPFFSTKGSAGTGLGLSMVHGFVKQSGGHTKIYSEVGRGTTIRLYLPKAQEAEAEAQATASLPGMAKNNEVILVVEDNKGLRDIAQHQLQSLGYRTLPACDAAQALEIIRGGTPIDLLFTDVVMPGGMDGKALAEAARRLRPGIRVLFTSGFTAAAASAAMSEEFGRNLISKPYRKDELGRRIRAALGILERL